MTPEPEPAFWPDGADEQLVRDCNCAYCSQLLDALEQYRDGIAVDGEHYTLEAIADGEIPHDS